MTLNITVAARWLMVQSSDFRLTRGGQIQPFHETAQKQVVLQYQEWSGLICYTGVAAYGSHDTSQWLGRILTHNPGQRTPDQVINTVANQGNIWLKAIPSRYRTLHTFTMVAHARNRAHIYLISNQELLGRTDLATPGGTFIVSHAKVKGTICVATGWPSAVTQRQRSELLQLLARNPPPLEMREEVAFASRKAATRADGKVGDECVVAHLLPDGTGGAAVFGRLKDQYHPSLISNGVDVGKSAFDVLEKSGPNGRTLAGLDWKSQAEKSAMTMYWHDPSLHLGSGWPPEDIQPGGIEIKFVQE